MASSAGPPACRPCGRTGSLLGILSGQGEHGSQNLQIPCGRDPLLTSSTTRQRPSLCGQRRGVQEEATHGGSSIPQQGPCHALQKLGRPLSPPRKEGPCREEGDRLWWATPGVTACGGMAREGVPASCGGLAGKEVPERAAGGPGPPLTWPSALPGPSAPAPSAAAAPAPAPAAASLSWFLLSASGAPPL